MTRRFRTFAPSDFGPRFRLSVQAVLPVKEGCKKLHIVDAWAPGVIVRSTLKQGRMMQRHLQRGLYRLVWSLPVNSQGPSS